MFFRKTYSLFIALAVLFVPSGAFAGEGEMRAMWADAWGVGFHNQDEVDDLVQAARTNNFNAIVVQMRRRGDAFYLPREPNGDPRTTALDPDFDALAALIEAAHNTSPRIEVHCWVIAFPVWHLKDEPPPQPEHIYNLHPEYLTQTSGGETFIAEGYYVDPGHPDAMRWTARMAKDIVAHYDIDGFHWDYIRYPGSNSGYNETAIARYNEEFGLTGQPASNDRRFLDWRRMQVGDFLRWVNADLLEIRPDLAISAAVFGSRSQAFSNVLQDWSAWNAQGIIDLAMPMIYRSDNSTFISRVNDGLSHQGARRVYVGQGALRNPPDNTVVQLGYARDRGALGTVLYSYRHPRSGDVDATIRAQTLAYIRDNYQPTWTETPPLPWKETAGIAKGRVIDGETGEIVYNAYVSIDAGAGFAQRSCVQGGYAFFNVAGGTWTVAASFDGRIARETVTATPGEVAHVDLVLREREPADPPKTILLTSFEDVNAGPDNGTVLFRSPSYSGTTTQNVQSSPNSTRMTRDPPAGIAGDQSLRVDFAFEPNLENPWLRLTTHQAIRFPNPILPLDRTFRFDIHTNQDVYVAIGIRDNGAPGLIGSNGGDIGTIEWVGGITDNVREGVPGTVVPPLGRLVKAGEWTTLHFQLPEEPVKAFNGTGDLTHPQGVFEHIAFVPIIAEDGAYSTNQYEVYLDNFAVTDEPPPAASVTYKIWAENSLPEGQRGKHDDPGGYGICQRRSENAVNPAV